MRRRFVASSVATFTLVLGLTPGLTSAGRAAAPQDATGPSSTVGEAAGSPSDYQLGNPVTQEGSIDLARCSTQVDDAARTAGDPDNDVLDVGTFRTDPKDKPGVSDPTAYDNKQQYGGSMTTVWDSSDQPLGEGKYLGEAPWATAVDQGTADNPTRSVDVQTTHNADNADAKPSYVSSRSADSGRTWSSSAYQDPATTDPSKQFDEAPQFGTQLRDGRVLTLAFRYNGSPRNLAGTVTDTTGAPASAQRVVVDVDLSAKDASGKATFLTANGTYRVTGAPVQLDDGTVLQAVYGSQVSPTDPKASTGRSITIMTEAQPTTVGSTDTWRFTPVRPDLSNPPSPTNVPTTFGTPDTNYNYTEMGMAQRQNGTLIGVVRELQQYQTKADGSFDLDTMGNKKPVNGGFKGALQWTSSSDGGHTWSPMQDVKGSIDGGGDHDPNRSTSLFGIAPTLTLLPSGLIALSSGDNDSYIAYSKTGDATGWTGAYTYRNCPTQAATPSYYYFDYSDRVKMIRRTGTDSLQWRYGSSGNTSLVTDGSGQLLQYGDNCHGYYWGCVRTRQDNDAYAYSEDSNAGCRPNVVPFTPKYDYPCQSPYTVDLTSRIWQRRISLVGPGSGKLDLAAMYRRDPSVVTGNMNWTSSAHPRSGMAGAFDGSTSYWSSAVSNGGAGTMTIDLGRSYALNKVGISLRPQVAESGTVQTSSDGKTWTTVYTLSNTASHALSYGTFAQTARYVRVNVDASSDCDAGLASSCAFLNEIELYSDVDGFENDPVNNLPRGTTTAQDSQVSVVDNNAPSVQPGQPQDSSDYSHRALHLKDTDTHKLAQVNFTRSTPAADGTLEFHFRPQAYAGSGGALLMRLTSGSPSGAGYEVAVFSDGTLHNFVGGSWKALTTKDEGPLVPFRYWSTLTVKRVSGVATVSLDHGTPFTVQPVSSAPATLDNYTLSSGGSAPTGDDFLVDDVTKG